MRNLRAVALLALWLCTQAQYVGPPAPVGVGGMQPIPAGTTNGTAIGTCPANSQGVQMYVPGGKTLIYTIATSPPGSPPASTVTIANPSGAVTYPVQENLTGTAQVYITSPTSADATLVFRCI